MIQMRVAFKTLLNCYNGAVHKVRHAIFGQFLPPPPVTLCHTSRDPPKVRHTSRTPPDFLVGLVQKSGQGPPSCTNSLSIVCGGFCPGGVVRGSLVWKVLSGVVLSIPPSVTIHVGYICYNRKLNITLNFMFNNV